MATAFAAPPAGFGPIGFWFINDDLGTDDLLAQLDAFAAAGFAAVCPCARIGLSPSIGYLTDAWFALIAAIVARADALGLRIVLYDEASYPSGSANGAVVAENPQFAARCLTMVSQDVTVDAVVHCRPSVGRSLWNRRVATCVGRVADGLVVASSVRMVEPDVHGLVRLDPAEFSGTVRVMVLLDAPSGGRIRGAYAWQDDDSPIAPAAANLLDPLAVASFIRHTHEAYATAVGAWFGSTVVALFTDEPDMLGRGSRTGARPWAGGLLDDLAGAMGASRAEVLTRLPALFTGYDDDRGIAATLDAVTADRLSRVYYAAQRDWCDAHGIALTGHPHEPDELLAQSRFTWPGQDAVWRWVLPGDTALRGRESASARTAASVAAQKGTATVLAEVFGAYGWRLSLDEVKWLLDWHLVRGTTAFLLHALFSSVRDNRAYESEPDLGLHNAWWPHLPHVLTYLRRMTLVLTSAAEDCDVAVIVTADRAKTDAVADLYRAGIPFAYAAAADLVVGLGAAMVGRCAYRVLVVDDPTDDRWHDLRAAGVRVLALAGAAQILAPDRPFAGGHPDLRVSSRRLGDERVWFLTNEGEDTLEIAVDGSWSAWDAWTGTISAVSGSVALPRRASVVLTRPVDDTPVVAVTGNDGVALTGWTSDATPVGVDWSRVPERETWSGAVRYRARFTLDRVRPLLLDLGLVGEAAAVSVNDRTVAHLFWAPHRCVIAAADLVEGDNRLEVLVTNSSANTYEGAGRPSGLLGPVTLRG